MFHLPVTPEFAAELAFFLIASHFIGDFVLQSEWLARAKVRRPPLYRGDPVIVTLWPYALLAHSLTHGFLVMMATGQLACALGETLAHAAIDYAKSEGWIDLHRDQALHLVCKALWWGLVVWGLV